MKKIFLKAPERIRKYRECLPDLSLPPEPVITRWGTWLEAAFFYSSNYSRIKEVVDDLDESEAESIRKAKEAFATDSLPGDLIYITTHFKHLVTTIKLLETIGTPLHESMRLVSSIQEELGKAPGNVAKKASQKLSACLNKNPGYAQLQTISGIMCRTRSSNLNIEEEISVEDSPMYKFSPLTSCDVERSFKAYKNVLTELRHSFTNENLEKYVVCVCTKLS